MRLVEAGEISDRTGASHVVTIGRVLEERRLRVSVVSEGISAGDAERVGFRWYADPQEAFEEAMRAAGPGARVLAYERI